MKVVIKEDKVSVYSGHDTKSDVIAELGNGQMVELGKAIDSEGTTFVEVVLDDGKTGYMLGDVSIRTVKKAVLIPGIKADVLESPSAEARTVKTLHDKDIFSIIDITESDDNSWVKIQDENGDHGFIRGDTKIKTANKRYYTERAVFIFIVSVIAGFVKGHDIEVFKVMGITLLIMFFFYRGAKRLGASVGFFEELPLDADPPAFDVMKLLMQPVYMVMSVFYFGKHPAKGKL